MARIGRFVVPDLPHHVTQRGWVAYLRPDTCGPCSVSRRRKMTAK